MKHIATVLAILENPGMIEKIKEEENIKQQLEQRVNDVKMLLGSRSLEHFDFSRPNKPYYIITSSSCEEEGWFADEKELIHQLNEKISMSYEEAYDIQVIDVNNKKFVNFKATGFEII
ncbi:MAG: hypothetical protein KDC47_09935 [Flavobacteriaceae bacterium]|nr:hypothetical protein [Flavobacteriaceae bacterium]